ncbi:hypothetical protein ACHAXR_007351, partial [Thalassiosira sp. AJA248-18]
MLKDDAATCGEEEKDARIENSAAGDDNETMIEDDGGNNKSGAGSKNSDAATNASSAPAIVVADPSVPVASAANTASTATATPAMAAASSCAGAASAAVSTPTTTAPSPATSTATQPAQQQQQLPPSTLTQQQLQQPHTITTPPKITLPPGQHSHSAPAPQIGPGWTQQLVQRRTPSGPYGKVDRYYVAPEGKRKLRSMNEVHRYLNSLMAGNTDVGNNSNNNNNNNANNTASYKQLRINTTTGGGSNNSRSSSAANSPRPPPSGNSPHNLSPRPPPTSGPGSGKGIDIHPFSRGSVIEVRYVKRKKVVRGDQLKKHGGSGGVEEGYGEESGIYGESSGYTNNWDEEEDDDESISDWFDSSDDDNDEDEANNDNPNEGSNSNNSSSNQVNNDHVYLADIIDRRSLHTHLENSNPLQKFKYYIHYRNFNRRMDEWITMERIVSPPSVGNARVRALKRKEDRRKREEEERKERERILKEAFSGGGIGRRDAVRNRSLEDLNKADGNATAAGTAVGVGGAVPNRKRLRRAASTGEGIGDTNYCDLAVSAGSAAALPSSTSMGETYEDPTGRLTRRPRREASVASGVGGTGAPSIATTTTTTSVTSKSSSTGALAAPTIIAEEHTAIDVVTTIAAQTLDEHEGMDAAALKEHEEVTKVKNVNTLELGKYQMDTWYFSPLPKELLKDASAGGMIDVLYVDEFSLNFFTRKEELLRYQKKTLLDVGSGRQRRHPPGNEIYRCGNLSNVQRSLWRIALIQLNDRFLYLSPIHFSFSVFEVDGFEERLYCQNLCYIAKLFLDHKTLYFDVDPFLFYV